MLVDYRLFYGQFIERQLVSIASEVWHECIEELSVKFRTLVMNQLTGPSHFNPSLVAQANMSLSQTENIFMPMNINS